MAGGKGVPLFRPESPRCQGSDCGSCGHRATYHERPGGSCLVIMPGALDKMGRFPECPCSDYFPTEEGEPCGCVCGHPVREWNRVWKDWFCASCGGKLLES